MSKLNRIVILGAGAAGLTTAESLRRLRFGGKILMVNAESTPPYDRPPLSKQVLALAKRQSQRGSEPAEQACSAPFPSSSKNVHKEKEAY